jgi:hypothetical protein
MDGVLEDLGGNVRNVTVERRGGIMVIISAPPVV